MKSKSGSIISLLQPTLSSSSEERDPSEGGSLRSLLVKRLRTRRSGSASPLISAGRSLISFL